MKKTAVLAILAFAAPAFASLAMTTSKNIETLNKMPLFTGLEEKGSNEDSQAQTLIGIFTKIQAESHKGSLALYRGTHAKGSCFDGGLKIYSAAELTAQGLNAAEIARLQKGLFAEAGVLKTTLRFANAKGDANPDTKGDVRGLSIAIDTTGRKASQNGDQLQDFMMNSSPMFAVKNITEFSELMKLARTAQGDPYLINPLYLKSDFHAKALLDEYERNDTLSYAKEAYWSNLPYSHGVNADGTAQEIVKFKLMPCDGKIQRAQSSGKADTYLQTDIASRVAKGEVCFNLQAQLFDQQKLATAGIHPNWSRVKWIENGGELWDEQVLPFVTIAQLKAQGSPKTCDNVGFSTRLHSTRANQPLGGIARVRAFVEENSRARRMAGASK